MYGSSDLDIARLHRLMLPNGRLLGAESDGPRALERGWGLALAALAAVGQLGCLTLALLCCIQIADETGGQACEHKE